MINARKALADLAALPGDVIALPKQQMADLLGELARHQEPRRRDLTMFTVAAPAASLGASA